MMKKKILAVLALAAVVPLVFALLGRGNEEIAASRDGERDAAVELKSVEPVGDAAVGEPFVGAPESAPAAEESILVAQTSSSLPQIGTRVIQTAFLRLTVQKGRFEETVERARTIAAGHGGFVSSATASKGDADALVRGTLVLRVPERAYAQVMSQLGRLGKVEAREESGQDVSAQFVDLQARARHLEAVETQLLELLGRANDVSSALAVQQQLNAVQLELEQVRGQLRYLDDQTSYETVSLDLSERGLVGATKKADDGWGIVEAWRDGAEGFVRVTSGIFVGVATVAPVLLLIGLGVLGGRFALVHRRRARRVDTSPAA
jgi:hypothetical protein